MSERQKKKSELMEREAQFEIDAAQERAASGRRATDHKRIRKVSPLGMRVLVRVRKDQNVSEGGLYLPEGAKQSTVESVVAEVLEVASAMDDHSDEEANISGIPLGAVVLIGKTAGIRVPWDESLRLVESKEVLAIVHEVSLS